MAARSRRGGSGPRWREDGGRRDGDGSAPDRAATVAPFVPPCTRPRHTRPPPPAEGRQRKALWLQPLPQLSRFKEKKKQPKETKPTKLYGADVKCVPSIMCFVPSFMCRACPRAARRPRGAPRQQPQWRRLNPLGGV